MAKLGKEARAKCPIAECYKGKIPIKNPTTGGIVHTPCGECKGTGRITVSRWYELLEQKELAKVEMREEY